MVTIKRQAPKKVSRDGLAMLALAALLSASCQNDGHNVIDGHRYALVWQDEFDTGDRPDTANWLYEDGFIRNHEAQYYTGRPANARVQGGNLVIEAHLETMDNAAFVDTADQDWRKNIEQARFTSASLQTMSLHDWQYGHIEVRAMLPSGVGLWPAIWMLGQNRPEVGWPACGEIDIMEHVGYEPDSIFGTVHTQAYNHIRNTQVGRKIAIENPYTEFHVYAITWTPDKIDFLLDGEVYHSFANQNLGVDEWPFDQPFYLKLNVAVGGGLGGRQGIDDGVFPQQMKVDYVRVYQRVD
ncbi:glycoside hydrolase family 16 protein [Parapedobacter sp. 2B3]|uniref:glycoside hydrolase family 16 protein n=1 Tax=Parapedobacter sp. 2B3 TaxID=3342381 RepID=UPI0035B6223E